MSRIWIVSLKGHSAIWELERIEDSLGKSEWLGLEALRVLKDGGPMSTKEWLDSMKERGLAPCDIRSLLDNGLIEEFK